VRLWQGLLAGMVAAGLAGCTNSAAPPPDAGQSAPASGSATASGTARPAAAPPVTLPAGAKAAVQAAAARFDRVYYARRYAASWSLLAPAVRSQVPENVWVGVHNGCASATPGATRVIRSVTVFGTTAIVTEAVSGSHSKRNTAEYVFEYADGSWGYSPVYPGIYHSGSIAADIGAAKAAGLCAGWKSF
jgi:hypothetical protein